MGYLEKNILPMLKHIAPDVLMAGTTLKLGLWYTSTGQAYLQRTDKFDESWLSSPTADVYVALRLAHEFGVQKINVFSNYDDCDSAVNALLDEMISEALFYIAKDKQSLFFNFWEKIRNSLAHGAFNKAGTMFYLVNQHKPKPDAKVNCIIQTQGNLSEAINKLWEDFEASLLDGESFKYDCLDHVLSFSIVDGKHYSTEKGCYVIIDDEFRFENEKRVEAVKALIEKYDSTEKTDIIVSENLGNISIKNLTSQNGMVRVIPQSKLIEYYGLSNIVFPN